MYYLIETQEQLERFFEGEGNECYLQFVTNNDETHPKLQSVCALYLYSFSREKGFMINIDHPEGFACQILSGRNKRCVPQTRVPKSV